MQADVSVMMAPPEYLQHFRQRDEDCHDCYVTTHSTCLCVDVPFDAE